MPNKTTARLAIIASTAILLGVIAGSNVANAATHEDRCSLVAGADRATCCGKVESTTFLGRLFGGGCTVVSRGDLGHGDQQSASATGTKSAGAGKSSSASGSTGETTGSGSGSSGGAGDSGDGGSGGDN